MSILKYVLDGELGKVLSTKWPHRLRFFLNQFHIQVSHLTLFRTSSFSLSSFFFLFCFFQKRRAVLMSRSLGSEVGWNTPCPLPSFALESCELLMPIERKDGTWDSFSRQSYHHGGWVQLQPHPGIHALQHQPEQVPAATCTYVSITCELKKISHQGIRKSLMTWRIKDVCFTKQMGYLWFQVRLRGILCVWVMLNLSRVCTVNHNLLLDL